MPYLRLAPELALVAEDDNGIGGFIVGTLDTLSWERRLERDWWPELRRRYPEPTGTSDSWTMDERRHAMIHHPEGTPADVVRAYPAHIHLNLLPRYQRQGIGVRLLACWLELAHGADAVHVGVNHANAAALRFWSRCGFQPLATAGGAARTIWMGRRLAR